MRLLYFIAILFCGFTTACKTDEDLSFAPAIDPKATYSFSITNPSNNVTTAYNLTNLTQQARSLENTSNYPLYTFMLKGKDKATQADVIISVQTNPSNYYLNIAIVKGETTTFYKDCNNFTCQETTGSDNKGNFFRLSFFSSTCITPTLASKRSMTIEQYRTQLNPIKFYTQE